MGQGLFTTEHLGIELYQLAGVCRLERYSQLTKQAPAIKEKVFCRRSQEIVQTIQKWQFQAENAYVQPQLPVPVNNTDNKFNTTMQANSRLSAG